MRRLLLVALVGLIAAYAVGGFVLLRDDDPLPSNADAVVVLAGSGDRIAEAQALIGGGIAPTLVISTDRSGRDKRRDRLCRTETPGVVCVYPGPFGTSSEAQAITNLAEEHDWDTIVLVTARYNLFRSERTFRRCGDFRVFEYGVDEPLWRLAIGVPLEWIKLGVSETVRRGC